MDDDQYWSIELNIKGIRLIHKGLSQAVEKWSGGHPDEQEDLRRSCSYSIQKNEK